LAFILVLIQRKALFYLSVLIISQECTRQSDTSCCHPTPVRALLMVGILLTIPDHFLTCACPANKLYKASFPSILE
jgi:hypothetical protein